MIKAKTIIWVQYSSAAFMCKWGDVSFTVQSVIGGIGWNARMNHGALVYFDVNVVSEEAGKELCQSQLNSFINQIAEEV